MRRLTTTRRGAAWTPRAEQFLLPGALRSGWDRTADVVVVGSGVAGLTAALGAARAGRSVLLITKGQLAEGSTCWAQGGVATALAPGDSTERHLRDTLEAGAGLCDERSVRALVEEGPDEVRRLTGLGALFDTAEEEPAAAGPPYAFTREGGHSLPRVVHAGGDATGREVQRTLEAAVRSTRGIELFERAFALDLVRDRAGAAAGLTVARLDRQGNAEDHGAVRAAAVVLATGGFGQLFATTSNPEVATGDGLALALRAGAEVADVEFVQFHPTVFFSAETGRRLLVSEAMRGEGATLTDATGARVMAGVHPREDLAPRDVVAHAIARRMTEAPGGVDDHVYLDARGLGERTLTERFPTIVAGCRAAGVDPAREPIPVAPAAHYACGGIAVDACGRTSVPGLYAAGEVACAGVHGANRLASNSLLEGLVMGRRVAREVRYAAAGRRDRALQPAADGRLVSPAVRREQAACMSRHVGVLRDATGLAEAARLLERLASGASAPPCRASWEVTNLHTVATVLVAMARRREESRGCHVRVDHPRRRATQGRHIVAHVAAEGALRFREVHASGLSLAGRESTRQPAAGDEAA